MKWKYEPETKTIRSVPENYWIASMDSFDGAVNHDANARLIAAAPEMLKTLKEIINLDLLGPGLSKHIKQIIAKAEGR